MPHCNNIGGFCALHNKLVQVGAGAELALGKQAFVKYEHRYANLDAGVEYHQNLVGVGLRF